MKETSEEAMKAEAKKVFHEAKYADENPGGDPVAIIAEAIQYAVRRAVEEEWERWTQGCPDSCAMARKLRYEDASVELRINAAVEAERERYAKDLRDIAGSCGNPDASEACSIVLKIVKETLYNIGRKE